MSTTDREAEKAWQSYIFSQTGFIGVVTHDEYTRGKEMFLAGWNARANS